MYKRQVFIFVLDFGVKGAAIATVISQMASCAFVLCFLLGKRPLVPITFGKYRWRVMKQVLVVGLSPFLIIASDSVLIIMMNTIIQHYGGVAQGDMLLTCNTIVQSFMLMITMPLGGITGGTQTIMGFNYGAGRPDRIRKAEIHIVLLGIVFTTVMFLIAHLVPQYFVDIFTRDPAYTQMTNWAIRVYTLTIIPLAVQYTVVDGFTGMGIAKVAVSLSTVSYTHLDVYKRQGSCVLKCGRLLHRRVRRRFGRIPRGALYDPGLRGLHAERRAQGVPDLQHPPLGGDGQLQGRLQRGYVQGGDLLRCCLLYTSCISWPCPV